MRGSDPLAAAADAVAEQAEELLRVGDRSAELLRELTATQVSRDRSVEITVDVNGVVVDFAYHKPSRDASVRLAYMILDCIAQAQAGLAERVAEAFAEIGLSGSDIERAIVDDLRQRFVPREWRR